MKIKDFDVERWMDDYEKKCEVNIAESCVDSMQLEDLIAISASTQMGFNEAVHQVKKNDFVKDLMSMKLTYGAIGANYLLFMSLVEPDDEVITFLPTYQQHYSVPESIGATVHKVILKEENNFLPDLDELRKLVNSKTKLINFPNPNNPTGAFIDETMLNEIIEIAKSVDAYILTDEAYRGMNHEGERFSTSIVDLYNKGISTSSMSKTFALAGLRTGWVCASRDVIEKVNIHRDYNHISCSMIDDYIASIALENKDKIIDRSLDIIKTNLDIVEDWLKENKGFSFVKPKAGPVIVIKYDLDMPSEDFCKQLLDKESVLVVPGSRLDIEGHFRVGIGNDTNNLIEGLKRIGRFYISLVD